MICMQSEQDKSRLYFRHCVPAQWDFWEDQSMNDMFPMAAFTFIPPILQPDDPFHLLYPYKLVHSKLIYWMACCKLDLNQLGLGQLAWLGAISLAWGSQLGLSNQLGLGWKPVCNKPFNRSTWNKLVWMGRAGEKDHLVVKLVVYKIQCC